MLLLNAHFVRKFIKKYAFDNHLSLLGFGQSHLPGSSSHSPSHNVPSSHSTGYPSGGEQYPAAPPSQTDYQQPSAIIPPTIPSSPAPAPFGVPSGGPSVAGYPAAGTPTPINTSLNAEQPSREYLPSRRTK